MNRRQRAEWDALLNRLSKNAEIEVKAGITRGDTAWIVTNGMRVVHIVLFIQGSDVTFVCDEQGEVPKLGVRKPQHPFVTKSTSEPTCLTCIARDPR